MDKRFEQAAFFPADILLPQVSEMEKWPVVACDQFTSQPEYWENAEKIVGNAPSALRLVLPEAYLNSAEVNRRIAGINASMEGYLADGVFKTLPDSLIYLERTQSDDRVRHGLTDNAVKYSGSHGSVRVELRRDGNDVVLTVADNGPGIPEEDLPRVFERFYRVDKARSRAAGGTGLGLSIVQDTVTKRGGTVSAANRPEGGAVFTVRWPAAEGGGAV